MAGDAMLTLRHLSTIGFLATVGLAGSATARASEPPSFVRNPFGPAPARVNHIDFAPHARNARPPIDPPDPETISFHRLDEFRSDHEPAPDPGPRPALPAGLVQVTDMVVPETVLDGAMMVPDPAAALAAPSDPAPGKEACAFPDQVPPGVYEGDDRPGGETPRRHTIFLNFNGGVLMSGGENSAENLSNIARSGHPYPVYTGGEDRAIAVAQAVAKDFEFVQARVVYLERPPKILPYTMAMVGGSYTDTTSGPAGGVAPLDCEDFGQRNVCYAFQNTQPVIVQANVVSQEVGHTMGLGHTTGSDRIMGFGYSGASGDLVFGDECTATIQVQNQGAACVGVNRCHCGDPDMQHDRNTLRWTYAEPGPDMVPPEVEILEPADGAAFDSGATVHVSLDVWDDYGGYGWKIVLRNADSGEVLGDQVDYLRTAAWDLTSLPDGTYELEAIIQDQADNVGTDLVTFTVGDPDGVGATTGAGSSGGGTTGGTMGGTSDGETDGAGQQATSDGCGCRGPGHETPGAGVFAVAFVLAVRRRR